MNKLRNITVGIALGASSFGALSGCSYEANMPPQATSVTPSTEAPRTWDEILLEQTHDGDLLAAEDKTVLLQSNAPINIIFSPNVEESETSVNNAETIRDVHAELGGLLMIATGNRYIPKEVLLTEIEAVDFGDCISIEDPEQYEEIQEVVTKHTRDEAINIAFLDAPGCESAAKDGIIGGYGGAGIPVVTNSMIDTGYMATSTAIHEIGHDIGLNHAGNGTCEDLVAIESCTFDSTGDEVSAMGYHKARIYTAPELDAIKLLDTSEVMVNPKEGIYTLGNTTESKELLKALTFNTDSGRVYISWEDDADASYDQRCQTAEDYLINPSEDLGFGITTTYQDGTVCKSVNQRKLPDGSYQQRSLQVRDYRVSENASQGSEAESFNLVTRPDRVSDDSKDYPASGEVLVGTVVYKNATSEVTYLGVDENGHALVAVAKT